MNLDNNKVEKFAEQVIGDISATFSGVMTNIGYKLSLYRAMAGAGALTSQALADKTGTHERYVREWLNNQTAGGYVLYNPETNSYTLPDEHIPVLADETSGHLGGEPSENLVGGVDDDPGAFHFAHLGVLGLHDSVPAGQTARTGPGDAKR